MLTTNFRREPCAGTREGAGEASVAVRIVAMIEQRKEPFQSVEILCMVEDSIVCTVMVRCRRALRCQRSRWMCVRPVPGPGRALSDLASV